MILSFHRENLHIWKILCCSRHYQSQKLSSCSTSSHKKYMFKNFKIQYYKSGSIEHDKNSLKKHQRNKTNIRVPVKTKIRHKYRLFGGMNQNLASQIPSKGNLIPNIFSFHMNYWHEIVRTLFPICRLSPPPPPRKILKFETRKKVCLSEREGFKYRIST